MAGFFEGAGGETPGVGLMVELACLWVGASHRGGEGGAWKGGEALGESAGEGELKAREGEQQEWKESHASGFLSGLYPNSF